MKQAGTWDGRPVRGCLTKRAVRRVEGHLCAGLTDMSAPAKSEEPRRRTSEVFACAITVGLADGSGLAFEGRGQREVKGLDRPIEVYRLA